MNAPQPEPVTLELVEVTPAPAPAALPALITPVDLLAMAVQRGADLDQLERLMNLKTQFEKGEAEKAFNQAMSDFKAEPIEILKRKLVSFTTRDGDTTSYKHAELSDVTGAVGPALAKHKLSYRWDVQQANGQITVTCILKHALGHSESVTMGAPPDGSGKKNAIQQVASTTTYLQRYTLLAITGLSTKGQDDDGNGAVDTDAELLTEKEVADHFAAIDAAATVGELKTAYLAAVEAAAKLNDTEAIRQFADARDKKAAAAKRGASK